MEGGQKRGGGGFKSRRSTTHFIGGKREILSSRNLTTSGDPTVCVLGRKKKATVHAKEGGRKMEIEPWESSHSLREEGGGTINLLMEGAIPEAGNGGGILTKRSADVRKTGAIPVTCLGSKGTSPLRGRGLKVGGGDKKRDNVMECLASFQKD